MKDLVGRYDLFREEGLPNAGIVASLSAYLANTGADDKNPRDGALPAFNTTITNVGSGTWATQSAAIAALRVEAFAGTRGQANFGISFPSQGIPGFLGGCVLVHDQINGSYTVVKVTAIE
ncbi:MAG: hypothetical protein ABSH53_13150 [Holophaga sp.]